MTRLIVESALAVVGTLIMWSVIASLMTAASDVSVLVGVGALVALLLAWIKIGPRLYRQIETLVEGK